MKKIIFVCTGNTCRSPMAEKLSQKIAMEKNLKLTIGSRGLSVSGIEHAHEHAIYAMKKYDLELFEHRATQISDADCSGDTLFLTMTLQHKRYLLQLYPAIEGNVFTLKEYAGIAGDVVDPYGSQQQIYDACAKELQTLILKIFDKLQEEHK